ncbi:MAG: hypothetical protein FWD17_13260, partial [Polyangiaceae bacterium]|nr:hypothetical protein [Polyangiaceae bacterium]
MTSKTARKGRAFAATGVLGAAAVIGALHAPFARGWLEHLGGCPLAAASRMTAVEQERARHIALGDRGPTPAVAHPAVGFTLDVSTEDDVRAWAARTRT